MRVKEEYECNRCEYDFDLMSIGLLGSVEESCDISTQMICYCKPCMLIRLSEILTEMKVPLVKHKDYNWLNRILPINYGYHERYKESKLILSAIKSNF